MGKESFGCPGVVYISALRSGNQPGGYGIIIVKFLRFKV